MLQHNIQIKEAPMKTALLTPSFTGLIRSLAQRVDLAADAVQVVTHPDAVRPEPWRALESGLPEAQFKESLLLAAL